MDDTFSHMLRRLHDSTSPWDYKWLRMDPLVTWAFVQANPDKPWDWSQNRHIKWEFVQANPGLDETEREPGDHVELFQRDSRITTDPHLPNFGGLQ